MYVMMAMQAPHHSFESWKSYWRDHGEIEAIYILQERAKRTPLSHSDQEYNSPDASVYPRHERRLSLHSDGDYNAGNSDDDPETYSEEDVNNTLNYGEL